MKNIEYVVEGDFLIIKMDLTQDLGPSASGKTQIIATSSGNQMIETPKGEIYLGLNLYFKHTPLKLPKGQKTGELAAE